jgi:hypothetical protein
MSGTFVMQGLLLSIDNPTTFVTTNPNHFLFPPACDLFIVTFSRMTDEDHERVTANNLPIAEGKREVLIHH